MQSEDSSTEKKISTPGARNTHYTSLLIAAMLVVALLAGYVVFGTLIRNKQVDQPVGVASSEDQDHRKSVIRGLTRNSPEELQQKFTESVLSGENDKYTKSAAYFLMHRYFDNKGNVYELYDYAHSHPALDFLNDAAQIYPDIFQRIEEKKLPTTFSEDGTYAFLAYLEVLDKKGYADVALQGTAANQYAKMAYIGKMQSADKNLKNLSPDQKRNLDKAVQFATNASKEVGALVDSKTIPESVYVADVVVGLNQYAYALRYFKFFGIPFNSLKTSEEIFALTTAYTNEKVPELFMFTSIVNASSLALIGGEPKDIAAILKPFSDFNPALTPIRDYSVIDRVLKARLGSEKEGVYSKENIILLAKAAPDFRAWLLRFGWTEADLK